MATAKQLLDTAIAELGTRESPAGSNHVKYNDWYYGKRVSGAAYPWCMAFVQWCCAQCGVKLPMRTASCGALMNAAKAAGLWVDEGGYRPGDIIIFDFPGGAGTDHTGICETVSGAKITTIDGNTGSGSEANGGAVMRRTRLLQYVVGAVRPMFEGERKEKDMAEEKRYRSLDEIGREAPWAAPTVGRLLDRDILRGGENGLDLSADMLRLLVMIDRAGGWDGR